MFPEYKSLWYRSEINIRTRELPEAGHRWNKSWICHFSWQRSCRRHCYGPGQHHLLSSFKNRVLMVKFFSTVLILMESFCLTTVSSLQMFSMRTSWCWPELVLIHFTIIECPLGWQVSSSTWPDREMNTCSCTSVWPSFRNTSNS